MRLARRFNIPQIGPKLPRRFAIPYDGKKYNTKIAIWLLQEKLTNLKRIIEHMTWHVDGSYGRSSGNMSRQIQS